MYILLVEKKLIFFFIDKSIIFYTIDNKMSGRLVFVPVTFSDGKKIKLPVCENQNAQMVAKAFTRANKNIKFSIIDDNDIVSVIEIKNDSNECPYGMRCFKTECGMNHPVGHDLNKAIADRDARNSNGNGQRLIPCKYGAKCNKGDLCTFVHDSNHGAAVGGAARGRSAASGGAATTDAK
jgi:hypothetical protein